TQLSRKQPSLQALIKTAMNPKNELKLRTLKELLQLIQDVEGDGISEALKREVEKIQPAVITNMARDARDKNAGRIIQLVCEKYLMIHPVDMGSINYDRQLEKMIFKMMPLTQLDQSSQAIASVYQIAGRLL
ncbi:MAG: hypothetical protein JRI36_13215, partial [Deltaproteobacteria bacterium]|nr:hypothetical protein [Deltaproteobacteria bacterium]